MKPNQWIEASVLVFVVFYAAWQIIQIGLLTKYGKVNGLWYYARRLYVRSLHWGWPHHRQSNGRP